MNLKDLVLIKITLNLTVNDVREGLIYDWRDSEYRIKQDNTIIIECFIKSSITSTTVIQNEYYMLYVRVQDVKNCINDQTIYDRGPG